MRYLINRKALTALVLATGAIEMVTNMQSPTLAAKLARQVPSSAVLRKLPTYIAQTSTTNSTDTIEKAVYSQVN